MYQQAPNAQRPQPRPIGFGSQSKQPNNLITSRVKASDVAAARGYNNHSAPAQRPHQTQTNNWNDPRNVRSHQPQQPQYAQQPEQLFIVVDLYGNDVYTANNEPFALPESMFPQVPVSHALDEYNVPQYYQGGIPVLVMQVQGGQWQEWTPDMNPPRRSTPQPQPQYGHHRGTQQRQPNQNGSAVDAVFRPAGHNRTAQDNGSPALGRAAQAALDAMRRNTNSKPQSAPERSTQRRCDAPDPVAPVVEKVQSQGFFDGEIAVQLHDGSVVNCALRKDASFRPLDVNAFADNLGDIEENFSVLITMVGDKAFEILVEKEKLMDRDAHVNNGRPPRPIVLEENEGTPQQLAVREEKDTSRPYTVELHNDELIDACTVEDVMNVALRASQNKGSIMMYRFEAQDYPMSGPTPKSFIQAYTDLDREKYCEADALLGLLQKLKANPVPGLQAYLNEALAEWCQTTIRYRLSEQFPSLKTDHFMDDFKEMTEFLRKKGLDKEFTTLITKEMGEFFNLSMNGDDLENEETLDCIVKNAISGYVVTLPEETAAIPRGRIEFDKLPMLYRTLEGAYKTKATADNNSDWMYVATAAGQLLKVVRTGSEVCPVFYVSGTIPA